jgi:hypothetical protein
MIQECELVVRVRSQVLFAPGGGAQGPGRILRVSKVSFNYELRLQALALRLGFIISLLTFTNSFIFTCTK